MSDKGTMVAKTALHLLLTGGFWTSFGFLYAGCTSTAHGLPSIYILELRIVDELSTFHRLRYHYLGFCELSEGQDVCGSNTSNAQVYSDSTKWLPLIIAIFYFIGSSAGIAHCLTHAIQGRLLEEGVKGQKSKQDDSRKVLKGIWIFAVTLAWLMAIGFGIWMVVTLERGLKRFDAASIPLVLGVEVGSISARGPSRKFEALYSLGFLVLPLADLILGVVSN